MAIWAEIMGIPRARRYQRKWWHHAAIGLAVLSSLVVYLFVANKAAYSNVRLTKENTYSLSLLQFAAGRQGTTTLDDLDDLTGLKGRFGPDGELMIVARAKAPDTIRCETPPRYKADGSFSHEGLRYHAIDDRPGQPIDQLRHCAATPGYATATASSILVAMPDSALVRKQGNKGLIAGAASVVAWLFLYWLVYYRGIVAIYLKRRSARHRRRVEVYSAR